MELLGLPADYYTGWTDHVKAVTVASASLAVKARISVDNLLSVVVGTASQILEPLKGSVSNLADTRVVPFDAE